MPADLNAARAAYQATPGSLPDYTDDAFVNWWAQNIGNTNIEDNPQDFALLTALADNGNQAAAQALTAGGYENVDDTTAQPLEQNLLDRTLPSMLSDVDQDAQRRNLANALGGNIINAGNAAGAQLGNSISGQFDGARYLQANPDVAQTFSTLYDGSKPGTKQVPTLNGGVQEMTADQFAQYHYDTYGKNEGRQSFLTQSNQLAADYANADRTAQANIDASNQATQTQLTALNTAAAQLQQNLTGNLATKAQALQDNIAALQANATTLDAAQRAALTQQIATQQQDLEQSIATQRQALQDQIAALGTAATDQSKAQLASLQQEIAGLNAAQAPLNAARSAAAELQATAVNTGLERTKDQLTAQNALAGYVGGSTAQDAALARATIDARQQAAQAVGSANVANAGDTRDIGVRDATGQRSIADALAAAQNQIAGQAATGNAALTTGLATGRQQLGDTQASGLANIANNTATTQAGINAYGANTTYGNTTAGADQSRSIADALAQGTNSLTSTNALNTQQAQQQGAAAKATYYDNDYNRSLSAALALPTVATNTTNALTALDNYGTSGLNRTQNNLNWWATNQAAAPTPGATAVQPSQTGNTIAQLGAGLGSAAISIGNANNWWSAAKPTVPKSSAPGGLNAGGSNLYTSPLT